MKSDRMGCPQPGACPCSPAHAIYRPPLTGCVQEGPALPTLPHGATPGGDELGDACREVITAVCQLKDIIDASPDDDAEHQMNCKFIDVVGAVIVLTQAVAAYNEPEDGGGPY